MADKKLYSLPGHYEENLGLIARGWSDAKKTHGIQIVSFSNRPEAGVTTFATLGLNAFLLSMGERKIRQELIISANSGFNENSLASFLLSLAELLIARDKAILRGEVIESAGPVVSGSRCDAVYAANPSPLGERFAHFTCDPPWFLSTLSQ